MKNWIENNVVPIIGIVVTLLICIIGWSYLLSERVTRNEVHGYYRQKAVDKMEQKLDSVSADINYIKINIEKIAAKLENTKSK